MNIMKKISLTALAVIGLISVVSSWASADTGTNTDVLLTLSGGDITIGSTGSIDLGTFNIKSSSQDVSTGFKDYFWVEDLKGADAGRYTQLQASDMRLKIGAGTDWNDPAIYSQTIFIPAANISMSTQGNTLSTLTGSDNTRVILSTDINDAAWHSVGSTINFILRQNATNFGLLGKYGIIPFIQVTIPAYQAVGEYKSILTYTLIEN